MDRLACSCVAVAGMVTGLCMVVWPRWAALHSREHGDDRPPTAGETWAMRAIGVGLLAGCVGGLYAILTGAPGAEFGAP